MAASCKQQQEKIEETVLQPIEKWVEQQEQKCKEESCNWWMLCINKLFCWIVTFLVKVCLWVTTVIVRWVYRTVCTVLSIVIASFRSLFTWNVTFIKQAILDLWELAKDAFYTITGIVVFAGVYTIDAIQTILRIQDKKRPLTEKERKTLCKIFNDSLNYNAIRIIEGKSGLLSTFNATGHPFTMGFNIYMLTSYTELTGPDETLVHECVHVWQFQFEGTRYIGNSAFNQFDSMYISTKYKPYSWIGPIKANGGSWYTLKSSEAQAQFIEDVFKDGKFVFFDPTKKSKVGSGAFFKENPEIGNNEFKYLSDDFTEVANRAWRILRTG